MTDVTHNINQITGWTGLGIGTDRYLIILILR